MQHQSKMTRAMTLAAAMIATVTLARAQSIVSFDPWTGPVGSKVTIRGTSMKKITGLNFAKNVPAQYTIVDDASIVATVPAGAVTGGITAFYPGTSSTSIDFKVADSGGGTTGGSAGGSTGGSTGGNPWVAPPNIPIPNGALSGHPRIFLNPSDVQLYQSWAKSSNSVWVSLNNFAIKCRSEMDQGLLSQDLGDGLANYNPYPTEAYAEIFAFMSLVDPNLSVRPNWAKRAHDLLMVVVNEAAKGVGTNSDPFRGPFFMLHNRSRWFGECFATTTDWCYNTFSAAEKAKLRTVFLRWIQENIYASATANEHPIPVGVVNNPSLISSPGRLKWAGNNYYCNHARNIGLLSMALDAADDVPATATDPVAGTLRGFLGNAIGAWLYQVDALENSLLKGGVSAEGFGYGESDTSAIAMLLLGMHTTGTDVAASYGSQANMAFGPFWSQEMLDHFLSSFSPAKTVQWSYIGPSYLPADYGDNGLYMAPNYVRTFAPLLIIARQSGNIAQVQKLRWMIDNLQAGGSGMTAANMSNLMQTWGPTMGIFYFAALDPNGSGIDPRPSMPVDNFSTGLGRLLSRTDWSAGASFFTFKCGWNNIDHQHSDGNMIEFYRKGEWLTKNRVGYGFNVGAAGFSNTIAIENPTTSSNWFTALQSKSGSQYSYSSVLDPTTLASSGVGFAYGQGDATGLYNAPGVQATDVAHASRSVLWAKPDLIFCYDRVDSKSANRFKRFHLNTQLPATVSGNTATAITPGGQKLVVRTLLPVGATVTSQALPSSSSGPDGGETAQGEIMSCRIVVDDLTKPKSVRFLHLIQGCDGSAVPIASTTFASTAGDLFDGVCAGNIAVMFKADITTTLTTTTFVVPVGTTKVFVAGLSANGGYTITQTVVASGVQYTIANGGNTKADKAGLLAL